MYSQEAVVNNQVGLHARPATFFYPESQRVQKLHLGGEGRAQGERQEPSGRALPGIVKGTPIKLIADGPDEKEAVEALFKMISSDFSE